MRSPSRVVGILLVALGLAFALASLKLPFRQDGIPGAAVLPFVASLVLIPLALSLVVRGIARDEERLQPLAFLALALLAAYAVVVGWLGFAMSTVILVFAWVTIFHRRGLLVALVMSLAVTAAAVLLFRTLLGVQAPLLPPSW